MPKAKEGANEYEVTPVNGGESYRIKADRYAFDENSGRHTFWTGEGENTELVANEINVRVRRV